MITSGVTKKTTENMLIDAGVVYVNYGLGDERLLGATTGGNKVLIEREYRICDVDGVMGKVKGLKRLVKEDASLETNLKEMSTENIMLALPGTTKTDWVSLTADDDIEIKGAVAADATTAVFTGTNLAGSLQEGDIFTIAGNNYTVTKDSKVVEGEITVDFSPAVPEGGFTDLSVVSISPMYDSIRSIGVIRDEDYIENIALVAVKSDNKKPCVIIFENALNDNNLELATKDKDESVVALKISAHYDPANMKKVPYEIRYPKVIL